MFKSSHYVGPLMLKSKTFLEALIDWKELEAILDFGVAVTLFGYDAVIRLDV